MIEEQKEPKPMRWTNWQAAGVASLLATSVLIAQTPPKKAKAPNAPYLKLSQPWPAADTMRQQKVEAEKRPLFASHEPLVLVLQADFKAINKDRTQNSTNRHAGTISVGAGSAAAIPVEFGSRGHFRLRQGSCSWVPLRVHFGKKETTGTVFSGQSSLKLVTHCRDNNDFEQHVLREYLPYRIYGLVTSIAFRARLAKITYVDAASGKPLTTRYGMFIEDDSDVARRAEARSIELPRTLFKDLDPESLTTMALFEYMIGNTDISIIKLHNVKLMVTEQRTIYPVPYDFDFSGLVDTPYANPDPKLGIATVRDRFYRGPCRSEAEFDLVLEKFRAKKSEVMALYDSLPDLNPGYCKQTRTYLENFYASVERNRVKKTLVDGCVRAPGM
jgi:hypothetical protein